MSNQQSITISGDLGSGKSTVAAELARQLGLRMVSMGDIHRAVAQSLGLTALQMNRDSGRSSEVDVSVDAYQRDLARSGEVLVVDSRLGWHFFPDAFKVQLLTDPLVAAERVFGRPPSKTEAYSSIEETLLGLRERSTIERARFLRTYGADKGRLENYDLICDTTSATPHEVVDIIIATYRDDAARATRSLFLDPARIELRAGNEEGADEEGRAEGDVSVTYTGSHFILVAGGAALAAALRAGKSLVRANLVPGPIPIAG